MPDNKAKYTFYYLILVIKSSTEYFVGLQQYIENPLLHFHGNTEHFYIDSYICANNNEKETYCCISMATLNTFILTSTSVLTTIKRKRIVAFPWQQWLR